MKPFASALRPLLLGMASVICLAVAFAGEPPARDKAGTQVEAKDRVSVTVARERAKTMQGIYTATLDMLHHRYFHTEKAVLPARAMEDVFAEIKSQSKVEANWISVNTKAMSIDHEPKTVFEKQAAREIAAGKPDYEVVEEGYYRRAVAIPLKSGCIGCHGGMFKEVSKTPRFAGLIISVPVQREAGRSK